MEALPAPNRSPHSSSHNRPSSPRRRNAGPGAGPGTWSTQSSLRGRRDPGPRPRPHPRPRPLRSHHSGLGTGRDRVNPLTGREARSAVHLPLQSQLPEVGGQLTKVLPTGRVVHVVHQLLGQPLKLLLGRLAEGHLGGEEGKGPRRSISKTRMVQDGVCDPGEGVRHLFLQACPCGRLGPLQMLSHDETLSLVTCTEPSWVHRV